MTVTVQASEWATAEEAAAIAGRSASWIHRHRRRGTLPAYRLDGRIYYRTTDVRALAEPMLEAVEPRT